MRFRLIAGAWCLAAAIVVNIYNSTLVSHLFVQKYYPLVRSMNDLIDQKDTHVAVRKSLGIDALISVSHKADECYWHLHKK